MPSSTPNQGRVAAVTGACTCLGGELPRRLGEDPRYSRVLALDVRPPPQVGGKVEFVKLDLTQPTVDGELATLLRSAKVDTFVHGAFLSHPTHAAEWAHELEDVGTMHVLNACSGVQPKRFVMISTTLVYGAHPKNPNFLTEDAELRGHRDSRIDNDKGRAERQVQRFAKEHPEVEACGLRFAPILGPSVSNMYTRFFSRPVAPVMMGHDPLMQFVHEQDAAWALQKAVDSHARGAFNIIGDGEEDWHGDADPRVPDASPWPNRDLALLDEPPPQPEPLPRNPEAELRELERRVEQARTPVYFDLAKRLPLEGVWRRWRSLAMWGRSDVVDDFGRDPRATARWVWLFVFLYSKWFRVEAAGLEHIPSHGRALLVASHAGTLPYDSAVVVRAVRRGHPSRRA